MMKQNKPISDQEFISSRMDSRPLSRLTYKIMGLNLIAVLVLLLGIFYLDQYRQNLTSSEMEILSTETRLYSSILSQGALQKGDFSKPEAQKLLTSFLTQKPQTIKIFANDGQILLEGKIARASDETHHLQSLTGRWIEDLFAFVVDLFSVHFELPAYPVALSATKNEKQLPPDVGDALQGQAALSAWQTDEGRLLLSSAVPLRSNTGQIGAVLVLRTDTGIEDTFAKMRLDILKLFLFALLITMTFSLYLAATIGHPIRRLAVAAEDIRLQRRAAPHIPDFSERQDEIGELSEALRSMTDELQKRIDSIGRFAADVAHELKNPLTSLQSAIETLNRVTSAEDRARLNAIIEHDLRRMDRLITDIAIASRLDAELSRERPITVDVAQMIRDLKTSYDQITDTQGKAPLRLFGFDQSLIVLGHPNRLPQIFQNLIDNALSFSPADQSVTLIAEHYPDLVRISVENYGPPIPEAKLEKIFDRFYSERPENEAFGQHSGLGLSIARQIT
jgi:two-component system sensor histidine kinase ChvG